MGDTSSLFMPLWSIIIVFGGITAFVVFGSLVLYKRLALTNKTNSKTLVAFNQGTLLGDLESQQHHQSQLNEFDIQDTQNKTDLALIDIIDLKREKSKKYLPKTDPNLSRSPTSATTTKSLTNYRLTNIISQNSASTLVKDENSLRRQQTQTTFNKGSLLDEYSLRQKCVMKVSNSSNHSNSLISQPLVDLDLNRQKSYKSYYNTEHTSGNYYHSENAHADKIGNFSVEKGSNYYHANANVSSNQNHVNIKNQIHVNENMSSNSDNTPFRKKSYKKKNENEMSCISTTSNKISRKISFKLHDESQPNESAHSTFHMTDVYRSKSTKSGGERSTYRVGRSATSREDQILIERDNSMKTYKSRRRKKSIRSRNMEDEVVMRHHAIQFSGEPLPQDSYLGKRSIRQSTSHSTLNLTRNSLKENQSQINVNESEALARDDASQFYFSKQYDSRAELSFESDAVPIGLSMKRIDDDNLPLGLRR